MRDFIFALGIMLVIPFYLFAHSDECGNRKDLILGDLSRPAVGTPDITVKKVFLTEGTLACRVDGSYPKGMPLHGVVYLRDDGFPVWSWDK